MKNKSVIFARVSTREQADEGYSLPAQEKILKEFCTNKEFYVDKSFSVPESASGKQERKVFNEMLQYLYDHPDVKVLVCEKVDRLTRNLRDAVDINKWLNEDPDRQVHFVKENVAISKDSRSNEKFIWNIKVSVAQYYTDNLSEETKKGLDEKAEEGWYPGNHKRGYKTVGDAGHKIWVQDTSLKSELPFIKKVFEIYDTGNFTPLTVGKELFKLGWISSTGKPIAKSEIYSILIDPFYCGEFTWHDKKYQGKHTPIISKELFNRIQDRLHRPIKGGKYRKHQFLFGNELMSCFFCNKAVSWENKKGHNYAHCTNHGNKCPSKRYIREELVEKCVLDILDDLIIQDLNVLEWIRKALKESHKDETYFHKNIMGELENKRKQLETKLDKLYDDRIQEKISKDFYDRNVQKTESELNSVVDAMNKHIKANVDYKKMGINIFELSQKGRQLYEKKATIEEKRELVNFVFSNFKLNNDELVPTLHNGFEVVAERVKNNDWLPD